jgi:hypothetical protein
MLKSLPQKTFLKNKNKNKKLVKENEEFFGFFFLMKWFVQY